MSEWESCRNNVLADFINQEDTFITDFALSNYRTSPIEDVRRDILKILFADLATSCFQEIREGDPNFPLEKMQALYQSPDAFEDIISSFSDSYDAMAAFDRLKAGVYSCISGEASWLAKDIDLENAVSSDDR